MGRKDEGTLGLAEVGDLLCLGTEGCVWEVKKGLLKIEDFAQREAEDFEGAERIE